MEITWQPRSPDKAPCDYFLWGICDQEIRRVKPRDLGELQEVVSDFVESLDEEVARRAIVILRCPVRRRFATGENLKNNPPSCQV